MTASSGSALRNLTLPTNRFQLILGRHGASSGAGRCIIMQRKWPRHKSQAGDDVEARGSRLSDYRLVAASCWTHVAHDHRSIPRPEGLNVLRVHHDSTQDPMCTCQGANGKHFLGSCRIEIWLTETALFVQCNLVISQGSGECLVPSIGILLADPNGRFLAVPVVRSHSSALSASRVTLTI
jgi:hypothetical protein